MWNAIAPLLEFVDRYQGLIIGFAALAAVLLLNQLIYRRGWTSYPPAKTTSQPTPAARPRMASSATAAGRRHQACR